MKILLLFLAMLGGMDMGTELILGNLNDKFISIEHKCKKGGEIQIPMMITVYNAGTAGVNQNDYSRGAIDGNGFYVWESTISPFRIEHFGVDWLLFDKDGGGTLYGIVSSDPVPPTDVEWDILTALSPGAKISY